MPGISMDSLEGGSAFPSDTQLQAWVSAELYPLPGSSPGPATGETCPEAERSGGWWLPTLQHPVSPTQVQPGLG